MTYAITLEQHIEELRVEYNSCCVPVEREAIWNALSEARTALAAEEAETFWAAYLAPAEPIQPAPIPF